MPGTKLHKDSGYIGVWKTKEDALMAIQIQYLKVSDHELSSVR